MSAGPRTARGGVVDRGDHGHPGPAGAFAAGELRGRGLWTLPPVVADVAARCGVTQPGVDHVDAGGVDAEDQKVPWRGPAVAGDGCGGGVLGVEVAHVTGRVDGDLHQLLGADPPPGEPGKAVPRLAQRAGHALVDHRLAQRVGVAARRQGEPGVGRVQVGHPWMAVGDPGGFDLADSRCQQSGMAAFGPAACHLIGADHLGQPRLGGGSGVEMVLQHLPEHLPAGAGDELLHRVFGAPGHLRLTQTGDQRVEQDTGSGVVIGASTGAGRPAGIGCHRVFLGSAVLTDPGHPGRPTTTSAPLRTGHPAGGSESAARVNRPGSVSVTRPAVTSFFNRFRTRSTRRADGSSPSAATTSLHRTGRPAPARIVSS